MLILNLKGQIYALVFGAFGIYLLELFEYDKISQYQG